MRLRAMLAVALLVGLAACAEQTITDKPDGGGLGEETSTQTAEVGDSITLHGMDKALEVKVTVLEVVDPAKRPQFSMAGKNDRLVGVKLEVENIGTAVYDDAASNGAVAIDVDSQGYDASFSDEIDPALGSPKIGPGDKRVGFITFIIPKGVELETFQFTLESGFGPETGEWTL